MTEAASRQNTELIIPPGWLAPVDADDKLLMQHSVVVCEGRIVDLLPSDIVQKKYNAAEHREPTQMSLPALIDKANTWRQRMGQF